MAKIIMQEYTRGVNLCNSISFTTDVLFPILSNTVSLSKSSFENLIVHSFGENKSASCTKASAKIHIIVQLELQNAFRTPACNTGQYFQCRPELTSASQTLTGLCYWASLIWSTEEAKFTWHRSVGFCTYLQLLVLLLKSAWLWLHNKEILLTGHGTLEIRVFSLRDWIKLPMYCEASGWIAHKASEASFLLLIWGETEVTVLDLYTYRGGKKWLQLSLSVFLTPGTPGVNKYRIPTHVYFRLWYFYSTT